MLLVKVVTKYIEYSHYYNYTDLKIICFIE